MKIDYLSVRRWPNRIAELRRERALTQSDLAAIIGTSQSTICAYEAGVKVPTVVTAAKIRNALGLDWADPLEESA